MASSGPGPIQIAVRTIVGLCFLLPCLFGTSLVCVAVALAGGSQRQVHRLGYLAYSRMCMKVGGTPLHIEGREHIEPGQAYVVVPNHASNWDAPLTVAALDELILRYVIKDEIMRVPIFGHALKISGNVHVIRRRDANDVKRIDEIMAQRAPEVSLLFFAEGTRSDDGSVGDFKVGAFATALGYQLPILPVAISGTHEVWPKGKVQLRPGPVCIEIGAPIETAGKQYDDRRALRDETQRVVRELHARATKQRHALEAQVS